MTKRLRSQTEKGEDVGTNSQKTTPALYRNTQYEHHCEKALLENDILITNLPVSSPHVDDTDGIMTNVEECPEPLDIDRV